MDHAHRSLISPSPTLSERAGGVESRAAHLPLPELDVQNGPERAAQTGAAQATSFADLTDFRRHSAEIRIPKNPRAGQDPNPNPDLKPRQPFLFQVDV